MKKNQISGMATAAVVAAVLIGTGLTVALAASGGPAPAGTEQAPVVTSSSTSTTVTTVTPSSVTTPVPPAPVPLLPQRPVAGNNEPVTDPQPEVQPEQPRDPVPTDANGNPLNPTNGFDPPPPPPPPNEIPGTDAPST